MPNGVSRPTDRPEGFCQALLVRYRARAEPGRMARVPVRHRTDRSEPRHRARPSLLADETPALPREGYRYVPHIALALHRHREWRTRLRREPERWAEPFVREVRRLAPFFPFIAGRVIELFGWSGHAFERGDWVVLDLYASTAIPNDGTSPTPSVPNASGPARSIRSSWCRGAAATTSGGRRCPGQWATIGPMREAAVLLAGLDYRAPSQDLTVDLARIATRPASGFAIELDAHRLGCAAAASCRVAPTNRAGHW